jgi:hypothetical protein
MDEYRSRVLASVHETAEGLTGASVMSKETMREFDELCLTPVQRSTRKERNPEGRMIEGTITVREVIRLLLEADSYPCPGNEDWAVAARMEAAALAKAETAIASPDDPPGFARWLEALRKPELTVNKREKFTGRSTTIFAKKSELAQ